MATTRNAFRWTLTPIILAALTGTAAAGSFTRGCAARDMQVLMMIEERENTPTISAEKTHVAEGGEHRELVAEVLDREGHDHLAGRRGEERRGGSGVLRDRRRTQPERGASIDQCQHGR